MFAKMSRHWWWFALQGSTAILFGLIAFTWQGATVRSFMMLFGSFALADGALAAFAALFKITAKKRWWIALHALVNLDVAIFTFIWPESAAKILLYLVAAWTAITGLVLLGEAKRLDQDVSNEQLVRRSGVASIIFSILVILLPRTGMLSVAQMTVILAILFGLLTIILSLNIRNIGKVAYSVSQS